ncbi:unnamed protein product [Brassicogethes aeneus]|uniref:Pleiotrophin/Midkine C-terminal domain-containing protein n=1 Tax=Brassicogethes aeneus TaxID=1431903 RepID=A0A9P0FD42_BRAAE|nr:unnamed protein product [Brassicogethes aeneus]
MFVVAANTTKQKLLEECRYGKGAWSECDPKTNQRSRTLTLKKGNQTTCESTKTIQKKCKKVRSSNFKYRHTAVSTYKGSHQCRETWCSGTHPKPKTT